MDKMSSPVDQSKCMDSGRRSNKCRFQTQTLLEMSELQMCHYYCLQAFGNCF
jgi:hypothetical protein